MTTSVHCINHIGSMKKTKPTGRKPFKCSSKVSLKNKTKKIKVWFVQCSYLCRQSCQLYILLTFRADLTATLCVCKLAFQPGLLSFQTLGLRRKYRKRSVTLTVLHLCLQINGTNCDKDEKFAAVQHIQKLKVKTYKII